MRIGIVSDIHEHVENLSQAIERLQEARVDQIIQLGDVCENGRHMDETAVILAEAGVIGVWGNHDAGLCINPDDELLGGFCRQTRDYMASLKPQLEIGDCLFSHVEPWLDPTDIADLWYYEGPPNTPQQAGRSFEAASSRMLFVGHFHRWLAVTPERVLQWDGQTELLLSPPERFLVVVAALCEGSFAILDTTSNVLTPVVLG